MQRFYLWKTPPFLWKTCGKLVDNFGVPVEKNWLFLEPVENSQSYPQVFHRHQIATSKPYVAIQKVFHSFHRLYYYYFK
ncbi:MAG: hypothetical protein DCF25_06525 [Leptolyngbya foveolarum]|uniref:Uncharacterized protein n=1 Tax=Leptolyngbya foveolarum TaxID=47253 RepID=A0A2W4W825_9CYAN|nr:MAG: hypothetical protein DCF25_06525 [Leptolyngbya foveolarum]